MTTRGPRAGIDADGYGAPERGFMDDWASAKVLALGQKIVRFAAKLAPEIFPEPAPHRSPDAEAAVIAVGLDPLQMATAHQTAFLIGQAVNSAAGGEGCLGLQLSYALGLAYALGGVVGSLPLDTQAAFAAQLKARIDDGQVSITHAQGAPNA